MPSRHADFPRRRSKIGGGFIAFAANPERGKFLSGLRKEVSVFEHVLDFYVDAVEAARKGWDKAEGFSGSKAEKPGRSRRACRRVRKRLTFKP